MDEKELQELGTRLNVAHALAGKREYLYSQITEQNTKIRDNNARVVELQKEVDAANADTTEVIDSLTKELDGVTKTLDTALASLEKEGYKFPKSVSKGSRIVSL